MSEVTEKQTKQVIDWIETIRKSILSAEFSADEVDEMALSADLLRRTILTRATRRE